MNNDLDFLNGLDQESQRLAHKNALNQRLEDWREVLAKPAGRRLMHWLLCDLGIGRQLCAQEEDVGLYNQGLRLLEEIGLASPGAAAELLSMLFIQPGMEARK